MQQIQEMHQKDMEVDISSSIVGKRKHEVQHTHNDT